MTDYNPQLSYSVYQPVAVVGRRPGVTLTAAVLGFVQAGLGMMGGLVTFAGLAPDDRDVSLADPFDVEVGTHVAPVVLLGCFALIAGGLLIAGSVLLVSGRDRVFYLVACGVQLVLCVVYFTLSALLANKVNDAYPDSGAGDPAYGFMVVAVVLAVMPILGMVFASVRSTTYYLQARAADPSRR